MENNNNLTEQLNRIESKLDQILEYQKWEKKQWDYSGSFEKSFKIWGGFYLASLAADETLGRNGTSSAFGLIK